MKAIFFAIVSLALSSLSYSSTCTSCKKTCEDPAKETNCVRGQTETTSEPDPSVGGGGGLGGANTSPSKLFELKEGFSTGSYNSSVSYPVYHEIGQVYKITVRGMTADTYLNSVHHSFPTKGDNVILEYSTNNGASWTPTQSGDIDPSGRIDGQETITYHIRYRTIDADQDSSASSPSLGESGSNGASPTVFGEIQLGSIQGTTNVAGRLLWDLPSSFSGNTISASEIQLVSAHRSSLEIIDDGSGNLSQIWYPNTLVSITPSNNGLKILVFEDITQPSKSAGLYVLPQEETANINATLVPKQGGGFSYTTNDSGDKETNSYSAGSSPSSWVIERGRNNIILETEEHEVTIAGDEKYETVITKRDDIKVSETTTISKTFDFGERIISEVQETGTSGVQEITTYEYYTDQPTGASDLSGYGNVKSVTYPDGNWVKYDYTNQRSPALATREYRPFLDAPASPDLATTSNSFVTYLNYNGDGTTDDELESKRVEYPNQYSIQTEYYNRYNSAHTVENFLDTQNGNYAWVEREETRTQSGGQVGKTSYFYYPNNHPEFVGRLAGRVSPSGASECYSYKRVNRSGNTFTENANGDHLQKTTWYGSSSSPEGVLDSSGRSQSMKVIEYSDPDGRLIQRENYVYTGSSSYTLVSTDTMTYELDTDGRVVAQAEYQNGTLIGETKFPSEQEHRQFDRDGTETITLYDSIDRVTSITIVGKNGIPDRQTTFLYEGTKTTQTRTSGSESLSSYNIVDLLGRVIEEKDEQGRITTYSYPNHGRDQTVTYAGGTSQTTSYYLDGRMKSVTGDTLIDRSYTYSTSGLSSGYLKETISLGNGATKRTRSTTKDAYGRIVSKTYPAPHGYQLIGGNPTERNNGDVIVSHTYDSTHGLLISEKSSADSFYTRYTYDYQGRNILTAKTLSNSTSSISSLDQVTQKEYFFEQETEWYEVTQLLGYLDDNSSTPTTFSVGKNRISNVGAIEESISIDSKGETTKTTISFDPQNGQRTQTIEVAGSVTSKSISTSGLLQESYVDGSSRKTLYTYDGLGRMTQVASPIGGTTSYSYNHLGQLHTVTDAKGRVTTNTYYPTNHQNAGLSQTVTNNLGETITTVYNTRGQETAKSGTGTYPLQYEYNDFGDLIKLHTYRTSGGTPDITEWVYDDNSGALKIKKDAQNRETKYFYYPDGKLSHTIIPRSTSLSITKTNTYRNFGELETVTYSDGTPSVTYSQFDRLGRPQQVATGSVVTYTMNYHQGSSLMTNLTSSAGILNGFKVEASYDSNGWKDDLSVYSGATKLQEWNFAPDTARRLGSITNVTDGDTYRFRYHAGTRSKYQVDRSHGVSVQSEQFYLRDSTNQVMGTYFKVAGAIKNSTRYRFDGVGRRERAINEDGTYWQYQYNSKGELQQGIKHLPDGTRLAGQQFEYQYDDIGNRVSAQFGGDSSGNQRRSISYTSNALNQYSTIVRPRYLEVLGQAPTGDIVQVNNVNASRQNQYFHRELSYSTSSNGSIESVNVTHNAQSKSGNLWVSPSSYTPSYDYAGNLTSDDRWDYTWDGENRLISMTEKNSVPANLRRKLEFAYDHLNRRIEKKVYAIGSGQTLTSRKRYLYDGWNCVAEIYDDGTNIFYTWGTDLSETMQGAGGVGGLLSVKFGANLAYPAFDGNGNITAYFDDSGVEIINLEYDPFGNIVEQTGSLSLFGKADIYSFSTKPLDCESGFYAYTFRIYKPQDGRWLNRDPIGENGGLNIYAFIGNDVTNSWDILGMTKAKEPYELSFFGAGRVNVFSYGNQYTSRKWKKALKDIVKYFDRNKDKKLTKADCPPFRIKMVGYSWGGWSALILARKLADKVDDEDHLKVAIGTLDPVRTLRGKGLGKGGLPKYVQGAWNVYQRNGMRQGLLLSPLFKGQPVPSAMGVGPGGVQDLTEFKLRNRRTGDLEKIDHVSIQELAGQVLNAVKGAKL